MATTLVLKNQYLSIDGTDISDYIKSATLTVEYDKVEDEAMGDDVHHSVPGLGTWSIEVEGKQSFAASELDSIIWPLVGAASASAIVTKPNGGTTSTSNPKWTANGRIFNYTPIQGAVGEGAKATFTIEPGDGDMIVRATSD